MVCNNWVNLTENNSIKLSKINNILDKIKYVLNLRLSKFKSKLHQNTRVFSGCFLCQTQSFKHRCFPTIELKYF